MTKKYLLWTALILVLVLAVAGLVGCKKKAPVTVEPPVVEEPVVEEIIDPIVWPYTGLEAPDELVIKARPLSVKIENSAAARPQRGLNSADVIYETIAEGGITRFNCIFQSKIPDRVEPVRSARLSDMWIVPQYGDGLFFFSGSNAQVRGRIKNKGIANFSHGVIGSALYGRSSARHAPHNLYLNLAKAYEVAENKGVEIVSPEPYVGLEFKSLIRENDTYESIETTVTSVTIPFSSPFKMTWDWNAEKELWLRSTNGKKQTDAETDKQVYAHNVVVMWAEYIKQTKRDKAGSTTFSINLGGEGKAAVFMNGKRIDCTWHATKNTPPVFRDASGNPIKLNPGKTWFEIPPLDINIKSVDKTAD